MESKKLEDSKKKLDDFAAAFDGLAFAQPEITEDEDDNEFFFLWDTNVKLYELFKIIKNYLNEYYALPENIILALLKEEGLPLIDSLEKLPYLHSGFVSVISPKAPKDGE